jgi:hypothetical protein
MTCALEVHAGCGRGERLHDRPRPARAATAILIARLVGMYGTGDVGRS